MTLVCHDGYGRQDEILHAMDIEGHQTPQLLVTSGAWVSIRCPCDDDARA